MSIKIALAQLQISADMENNMQQSLDAIDKAADANARLICFPELQLSPFFPQYPADQREHVAQDYAMAIDHPYVKQIQARCRARGIIAIPNFYLHDQGSYYDASPLVNADGRILGVSKMVNIPQVPQFYEQDYYQPSDTGFLIHNTAIGKIAVVICYDRHLPENIRYCVGQGAQLIIIPTANTSAEPMELFEWEIRVAAYQSRVTIAMCNRVGREGEMDFAGESLVAGQDGALLVKAGAEKTLVLQDIDCK